MRDARCIISDSMNLDCHHCLVHLNGCTIFLMLGSALFASMSVLVKGHHIMQIGMLPCFIHSPGEHNPMAFATTNDDIEMETVSCKAGDCKLTLSVREPLRVRKWASFCATCNILLWQFVVLCSGNH
jgi:hypothetical protein